MESGGRTNRRCRYSTRTSAPGIVIGATRNRRTYESNRSPQQTSRHRGDQHFPIAKVVEIMRRILPAHADIDDDAKEAIQECISKFICFVTAEANKQCHQDSRNTITSADVLSAMNTLGFHNYVEPLTTYLNNYRAQDPERSSMHHGSFVTHTASYIQEPTTQMARSPLPQTFTMGYNLSQQLTSQLVQPQPPSTMAYGFTHIHTAQLTPQPSFIIDHHSSQLPVDLSNYVRFVNDYFMNKQSGGEGTSSKGGEGSSSRHEV